MMLELMSKEWDGKGRLAIPAIINKKLVRNGGLTEWYYWNRCLRNYIGKGKFAIRAVVNRDLVRN